MRLTAALPGMAQPFHSRFAEALLVYERRFGALPLVKQAVGRGAPLAAAGYDCC